MKIKSKILMGILAAAMLFTGCSNSDSGQRVLKFGIIPFENSEELLQNLSPMLNVMSKGLGMEVKPFVAADYTGVVEAFRGKKLDIASLTAASYIMAHQEANVKVVLKSQRNGNPFYYSAIITRNDSGINNLQDLKGKRFSFGDPLSTSGTVFPKKLLLENKINPETDFSNIIYSGSHDAIVLSVLNKKVDAGATFSDDKEGHKGSWTRYLKPDEVKQIKVVAISDPIPSDNICVSEDLDPKIVDKLVNTIIDYGKTKEGKETMARLYKFEGYVKSQDSDYDVVRKAFEISGVKLKDTLKKK